jgi:hypothetical protein
MTNNAEIAHQVQFPCQGKPPTTQTISDSVKVRESTGFLPGLACLAVWRESGFRTPCLYSTSLLLVSLLVVSSASLRTTILRGERKQGKVWGVGEWQLSPFRDPNGHS